MCSYTCINSFNVDKTGTYADFLYTHVMTSKLKINFKLLFIQLRLDTIKTYVQLPVMMGNANGVKVRNFKVVTITQFTKLE